MKFKPEPFMQRALDLARQGLGRTAPNPAVGAVVVRDAAIVGEGFHARAGQPHAEIVALQQAGELARGAELYVTLEPCCHHGRTGPCTEAIIDAGITRVSIGTVDPNPRVSGKGVVQLQAAGIDVAEGPCQAECRELIAPFAKHLRTGLPYVVYKAAMTLDGQTATANGESKWISSEKSRDLVHQLRNQVDGIMVGAGTVVLDDPKLTARPSGPARDPVRIVFDGSLSTAPQATVYTQASKAGTLLVTAEGQPPEKLRPYRNSGAEIVLVGRRDDGLNLHEALRKLAARNLHSLMLEGGSHLAAAMLKAELIDRVMIFVAPIMVGGHGRSLFAGSGVTRLSEAYRLQQVQVRQVDEDLLLEGEVQYVHRPD